MSNCRSKNLKNKEKWGKINTLKHIKRGFNKINKIWVLSSKNLKLEGIGT